MPTSQNLLADYYWQQKVMYKCDRKCKSSEQPTSNILLFDILGIIIIYLGP